MDFSLWVGKATGGSREVGPVGPLLAPSQWQPVPVVETPQAWDQGLDLAPELRQSAHPPMKPDWRPAAGWPSGNVRRDQQTRMSPDWPVGQGPPKATALAGFGPPFPMSMVSGVKGVGET